MVWGKELWKRLFLGYGEGSAGRDGAEEQEVVPRWISAVPPERVGVNKDRCEDREDCRDVVKQH